MGRRESHAHGSGEMAGRLVVGEVRRGCRDKERDNLGVRHIFTTRDARRVWMVEWWWCEMNKRARARGHARLRAHELGRVVCAHSMLFELRRKGVAGHRPRALPVWGVPHQIVL